MPVLCTDAVYGCYVASDCREPITVAVHGKGFVEHAAARTKCRITGVGNDPDPQLGVIESAILRGAQLGTTASSQDGSCF